MDYKYCQGQINFTEEIRTNYYGDILSYFNDTLDLLSDVRFEMNFQKSIFQAIGLMQIMYIHQDLTDELLYIFRLHKSTKADKNPIREVRNELVGHPIRRIEGKLISSVFFGREFNNGTIDYFLYSAENNYRGKEIVHDLTSLIENHEKYLSKFLQVIWTRIEKILRQLQKKLKMINLLLTRDIELLNVLDHYYNPIFEDNYLFKPDILLSCYGKQNEHPRYRNTINLFLETLEEYIPETISNIDNLFSEKNKKFEFHEPIKIEVKFIDASEAPTKPVSKHLHYEFSKLFEKHPVFGIDYFKEKFKDHADILEELNNMQIHKRDNLEFYSSYEYLREILIEKGYLER